MLSLSCRCQLLFSPLLLHLPRSHRQSQVSRISGPGTLSSSASPGALLSSHLTYLHLPSPQWSRWHQTQASPAAAAAPFDRTDWEARVRYRIDRPPALSKGSWGFCLRLLDDRRRAIERGPDGDCVRLCVGRPSSTVDAVSSGGFCVGGAIGPIALLPDKVALQATQSRSSPRRRSPRAAPSSPAKA